MAGLSRAGKVLRILIEKYKRMKQESKNIFKVLVHCILSQCTSDRWGECPIQSLCDLHFKS